MKALISVLLALASLSSLAERGALIDMRIETRNDDSYREYRYHNQAWVAGEQGQDYQVRLRNLSGERVLVLLAVDGVNAVSGQTAGYQQPGYVLEPWQETVVSGWRKSLDQVARFYFTNLGDSYAARTGRPADVGVIGAAVFREKVVLREPIVVPFAADKSAAPAASQASRAAAAPEAKIRGGLEERQGTGHGAIEDSTVTRTTFERASRYPAETVAIRYDSRRNLAALGVIRPGGREDGPNPFPQEGFVPDPPRYSQWTPRGRE